MKQTNALLFLVVSIIARADTMPDRKGMRLAAGFPYHPSSYGVQFEIASPRLFVVEFDENKRRIGFSISFDYGFFTLINGATNSSGNTVSPTVGLFGLGLRMSQQPTDSIVQPYTIIGAQMALWDSSLATKSTSFAFRIGFGCDFVFLKDVNTLFGRADEAFYVQLDLAFGHRGADKIAGTPNIVDGITPSVGYRTTF